MTMPVSGLRFEPLVDVQARNLAEGQADVAIRGGVFENTGFILGTVSLYDPQTGHYYAEIPVPPAMLRQPDVLTGTNHAYSGFNATAGSVRYEWGMIEPRGQAALAMGEYGMFRQSLYQGFRLWERPEGATVAMDLEAAKSSSDGTVPSGDHDFARLAGRLQLRSTGGETNLFAGYQSKFFGWPNLYTPFGFNETESLQTTLFAADHRQRLASGEWRLGAYWRRNKDDYEFNRAVPGASNPFQHTTRTQGAALEARQAVGFGDINVRAQFMRESIVSTALTFGRYSKRDHLKLSATLSNADALAHSKRWQWATTAGVALDDTNRDSAAFSPLLEVAVAPRAPVAGLWRRTYLQYSRATQVPTYTALNSNPAAGLFRGNASLGRERTDNIELGADWQGGRWTLNAAGFVRRCRELTDWTFRRGVIARTANAVDLDVMGIEAVAMARWENADLVLAYTWLAKSSDYRGAAVDASFYALNYPKHRLTAALTWRPAPGWEIRWDNEFRLQADNLLRRTGGDEAALAAVSAHWVPPFLRFLEVSVACENLWDSHFEEVPAVPASRRQASVGLTLRW